jgi:xeroderma pigmentosum group C-complementing protein
VAQADLVVQPYHLPKFQYSAAQPLDSVSDIFGKAPRQELAAGIGVPNDTEDLGPPADGQEAAVDENEDEDMEEVLPVTSSVPQTSSGPITMEQLASNAANLAVNGAIRRSSHTASSPATSTSRQSLTPAPRVTRSSARKRRKGSISSEEENVSQTKSIRSKRGKAPTTPALEVPTRVLRTRKSKTAAQLQEEAEAEEAYRRAAVE